MLPKANKAAPQKSQLTLLPVELQLQILQKLSPQEQIQAGRCCRSLAKAANTLTHREICCRACNTRLCNRKDVLLPHVFKKQTCLGRIYDQLNNINEEALPSFPQPTPVMWKCRGLHATPMECGKLLVGCGSVLWRWEHRIPGFWANSLLQDSYKLDSGQPPKEGLHYPSLACQDVRCSQCSSRIGLMVTQDNSMAKENLDRVQRFLMYGASIESITVEPYRATSTK
ncbi:hypothetical protein WJX74_003568 [Apatococcus lobatus]|uniref:F-box domain-containing protein n=1 Tax=Apatococcus lobatus TaxID=904363 RepID=A0AAW1QMT8_9CHLO